MQLSWSHMVVKVRDIDAIVDFYRDVLGFEIADDGTLGRDSPLRIVFMSQSPDDHHQIAFAPVRKDEETDSNSVDHVAFRVGSIAEVREMMERVEKYPGIEAGRPITHGNAISVYFKDPEGNGIEVFCDTPWHVAQPAASPWDPALSDEELLREIERKHRDKPEFRPMEEYRAERARLLGQR